MSSRIPSTLREWWFGAVPENWRAIPLKHLCNRYSLYGANIPAEMYESDGVRFLRTTDIGEDGTLGADGVFVPREPVAESILAEGDFLISRSGTVGRAFVYRETDGPCSYAGYLVRYVLNEKRSARWLFYVTKSAPFAVWLGASAIEATIGNVNGEKYANLVLPVPPFEFQRAISDFLDRETARLDALVAAKQRLLDLLAEKRKVIIATAVTRGLDPKVKLRASGVPWLDEVPGHWDVTRLKFVARVQTGIALGKNYSEATSEYPYLRVANVQDGFIDLTEVKTMTVPEREAALATLRKGDVLMNEGGDADKLGRGAIWDGSISPCLHQNHVFALRPESVSSEWLSTWTGIGFAKSYFETRAKQSTNLASISSTNLLELPIAVPSDDEQRAIVDHIARETAKLDAVRAATERTIALLKERRSALIAAAVTGQLDAGAFT